MKPKRDRWYLRALALVAAGMLAVTLAAAEEAGSQGDPLVTLSYLNETFLPRILAQAGGTGTAATADNFVLVELTAGQRLGLGVGAEVMLRVGSAVCLADSSPGLIDETTAGVLENGGALVKNHLYMATVEGRALRADSQSVKALVRGGYTVS